MASTSQSAKDYVKNARLHLVRELRNLSVILENLYQQGVLCDEEVSKIQAERDGYDKTRKILDSVTKKGEAACYVLLKIIDMTRKRTLERPPLLPEKSSEAPTESKKFDLHHWISCFSFKDTHVDVNYLQGPRPCHRYQEKLKSKVKKISNEFWLTSKTLFGGNKKPDLSYTSLVLDTEESVSPCKIKKLKKKKSNMSRPKKLRKYIPEEKPDISPTELLETDKNILLVGKPGIGKTTLTHEMLRLWAERESKELDYMFYFDMRETSHIRNAKSLEELLFGVFCEPDEGKDEVLQDILRHSDNVTIIFDGLTDLCSSVVEKLLKKDLLPLAKIIITCRADDEDEDLFSGNFDRVEVKGFSEQTIKTYLSATLGEDQTKVLSNLELITLCHVPMYALMVAACFSSKDAPQPCTITEIYINIVRFFLQINSKTKKKDLNSFIKTKREEILSLAEVAFLSAERKTVNLTDLPCEDSCVLSFLKPLLIKEAVTETITTYAFLHYTVQEFFAALWLLKNPDKIRDVYQQCLTEEKKHMKHLIPFMCRLLNEKSPSLMKHLIPDKDLKNTSNWFFKELINTFLPHLCEQEEADTEDILFLCQCLYESQSPEACIYLLDKLDYHLDLSGESLDPYPCCAVAYVVTQSKERKILMNLEDVIISEQGMRQLFGCLENVEWCDPLPRQMWEIFLVSEEQMDFVSLLSLDGNQLHLPVDGEKHLFERAVEIIQRMPTKVNVCLYWDRETSACQSLCESLLEALLFISSLSFRGPESWSQEKYHGTLEREQKRLFMDLCLKAALHDGPNFYNVVKMLLPLFPVKTDVDNIFLDLFQYVKSKEFLGDFQGLRPFFLSAPAVWSINLSERKTSILLEVLKLQPEKKQVKLTGCSHEESEVRSFLQCLPYISQLSVVPQLSETLEEIRFFGNLFCAAAEREQQTGEKMMELLSSVCTYRGFHLKEKWCDFLMDLYTYDTKTVMSVLPSLQSVFQSAPAVWSINLSERKTSILLEVLKLQPEKKQVELTGCSHEESEVRSFLQCLPYISQLSFVTQTSEPSEETRFFRNLFCAAAKREQQTGEKILELLASVCTYQTFILRQKWCDFLMDLYSYETKTGLSVLPSLQSVFQSAPAVWSINLSERKTSILLEVLKLQPEKKHLHLTGCSHEESEVRKLLQCLPYISQLSFVTLLSKPSEEIRFFGNLFCAAAERQEQTGEKILELLSSVCRYKNFPLRETWCDFLIDLYYYRTKTGLSVLPSLKSVFQSTPPVWFINLSERKTSILLEVLKLQPEKKQVVLTGCSHEESEVRSFLQCLPYISQLSVVPGLSGPSEETRFFVNLFCAAAEREQQTGEKILELLSSVCTYRGFTVNEIWCDFLLDLYSHVKDCETKTGLSVLPSLQSVFQSAPAVWSINLSERKTSILLEVLKLQPEKKQVELTGCSHEESEVRSFLQCLPYISQLSFVPLSSQHLETIRFIVNLFCAAAEREQQTGEKILELLSSVCTYRGFTVNEIWCDFLLDLYSHVKDCETKTGLSVLPSLQSVFQSAPAVWSINLSERKTSILLEVLKLQPEKKKVELTGCSHEESEVRSFLQCLPYISQLSVDRQRSDLHEAVRFFGNLFCAAAEREQQTGEKILELLSSVCTYQKFPVHDDYMAHDYQFNFLLDLYSHVKDYETKTGLSVLPSLQSVFQSAPAVWSINLSERKTSILLEVLRLQPEKKQVELTGCSHEESEVRSFLQSLPYISQLSVGSQRPCLHETVRYFGNLFCAAAESEEQTGEKILELLSSVCSYQTFPFNKRDMDDDIGHIVMINHHSEQYQCDFLLDLYSHVKDFETKTGLSVLPSLQSVFQSAPAVWSINLSERKTSILLEVLKLQPEKKQVKLTGCSHEESEVRSFLQCLPYISQLSVNLCWSNAEEARFFVNLFCAAAEREQQTGEKILELLSSVCTYQTFPFNKRYMDDEYQCDFLLDLYFHVKDFETQTGLSVLPSLKSVFQSAPAVWFINLSERKTSILLEVLKLQPEKKPVKLRSCSHEESEARSFLQCLPYISQLSVEYETSDEAVRFFVNLFCAAAEREQQAGEKILELLSLVCTYERFPFNESYTRVYQCNFLLDLYSHVKSYEAKTGLSVLPSLQSVFSAPAVWFINLAERKTSILLEVLKLQPEKKQVELTVCSQKTSKVRSFLQCLPYISQLSVDSWMPDEEAVRFFVNLFCAAAEREQQTGEKILELLSSVCTYQTFPVHERDMDDDIGQTIIIINHNQRDQRESQCYFLLDLYSHVKDCKTETGLSFLPSLHSVFQSAPAVWFINLSERKTSILLEVLKLQPEKKQVKLTGCSHEESEVRSFLQCLPYISQLSCDPDFFQSVCTSMSVRSREEAQQLESLLQLLGFQLLLTGELHKKSCWSVGRVLKLCGSKVDLILTPSKMSARGAALLFRHTTQLHSLRLSIDMSLLLFQWVRRGRVVCPLAVEELSLVPKKARPSHRVMLRAVSSLASLLRYWTVGRLDLTETCIPAQGLITLLLHDGPLTVKLSEESFQLLQALLHEIQDKDCGTVVRTVASQQEGPEFHSTIRPEGFCVEFECSPQVLWLPPTVQRHPLSGVRLIGNTKLPIGVSTNGFLSLC
uniref:NACHT domain-containing protein n=1 Tax=Oreochromis aureus TaxID=47969 RepID=A0AAZ1X4Y0_OREAU